MTHGASLSSFSFLFFSTTKSGPAVAAPWITIVDHASEVAMWIQYGGFYIVRADRSGNGGSCVALASRWTTTEAAADDGS
ncbi:unnamed protein product [Pleuronectes platessa]|uniref:Secreted protein n=1 Tax=Pleuronectes platessa TaxID=8262 RepID=A0A9N7TN95_PLEPL|nr:unnamed protein product [Pleuronectes platessa]